MWCEKLWNGLKIPFVPDLLDEMMHEGLVVLRHAVPPYVAFLPWCKKPNANGERRLTLDETGAKPKNVLGGPSAPVAG